MTTSLGNGNGDRHHRCSQSSSSSWRPQAAHRSAQEPGQRPAGGGLAGEGLTIV